MSSSQPGPAIRQAAIALKIPVLTLVAAATAIPVEWRPAIAAAPSFSFDPPDIAANLAAFVVVGVVLADLGFRRAALMGALISAFAEISQFFMMHRDPSPIDFACNVIGTMLGIAIVRRWKSLRSPELTVGKWRAALATLAAVLLVLSVRASSGDSLNPRGVTSPGTLEARWPFDEPAGSVALDSTGHGLQGRFHKPPQRVPGVRGTAGLFDGPDDYIDAGHAGNFRLTGSMTITAWINARSFPPDDAAIVSNMRNKIGYQLDTTVDKHLRGIGFKFTNFCGEPLARYGATPLVTNTWYHIAGVYRAEAQTADVYLNGKLDNGILEGTVTALQRSSRAHLYIGRRTDLPGFEFNGSIDEVHLYSFALTGQEIVSDMHGNVAQHASTVPNTTSSNKPVPCGIVTEYEDSKIPAAAAVLGALVVIACIGFRPSIPAIPLLTAALAAGFLLIPVLPFNLPAFSRWTTPLVSAAGGWSIIASRRPTKPAALAPTP